MCFIRVNTKHQPIKPPGAAPTLTNVYDRTILETSVDIANPTTNGIVKSLNINEKLQAADGQTAEPQAIRRVSVEEVSKKKKGKRRESMPEDWRGRRNSKGDMEKPRKGGKAIVGDLEAERQRSLGILKDIQAE